MSIALQLGSRPTFQGQAAPTSQRGALKDRRATWRVVRVMLGKRYIQGTDGAQTSGIL